MSRIRGVISLPSIVTLLGTAGVTFWLAYDDGGYSLTSRTTFAIGLLWAIVAGVLSGLLPAGRPSRWALLPGVLLAGFAVWTAASTTWAVDAEGAFFEFDRVALYLAVFAFAALAAGPRTAPRLADGLALGITAVGFLALASRLFPGLVSQDAIKALLPTDFSRVAYPINYWNALGMFLALAFPLLLRSAVASRSALWRGASVAPLPALSAVIYLTSSRGAVATGVAGVAVFFVLARERWAVAEAVVLTGVASLVAVLVVAVRPAVVDPPLSGAIPSGPGRTAAVLVAIICLACGAAYALRVRFLAPVRLPALAGRLGMALVVLGAAVAIGVSHPVRQFEEFKKPPPHATGKDQYDVLSHLFSSRGSGRWQYWSAGMHEFRSEPLHGGGAGSYEAWWAQFGALSFYIRDAHSLYVEVLGELGVVGFILLVGALLSAIGVGATGVMRAGPEERETRAALCGSGVGFLVAAGVDWMWELTAVSVVGITCLGLLAGLGPGRAAVGRLSGRGRIALAVPTAVVGLALVVAQGIALLGVTRLDDSRDAVARGDTAAALSAADAARDLQPWAATPYLQLALIEEQAHALGAAEQRIKQAIKRNRENWRLWLIAARIQTKRGDVVEARRSLARARELNPRSPYLRD